MCKCWIYTGLLETMIILITGWQHHLTTLRNVSVRGRHPLILEGRSRCAEVRQNSGVSVAVRLNRCDCGNAVVGGSGHCWTLGGDAHTRPGAVNGGLSSKLTSCLGDVGGSSRRLGVAQNRAAGASFPPTLRGIFYLLWNTKRERSQEGFPSTMEPRTAGSVSRAEDTQESPRESRAWQCRNCASTFPGPILFNSRRTTSLGCVCQKKSYIIMIIIKPLTFGDL